MRPSACHSKGWRCSYCWSSGSSSVSSVTDTLAKTVSTLESKLDTLHGEIIDIVNNLENISQKCSNPKSPAEPEKRPGFQNPSDMPDYDSIEVAEVAQVHVDAEVLDNSVTSIDMNVPEVMESATSQQHLNSHVLTSQ